MYLSAHSALRKAFAVPAALGFLAVASLSALAQPPGEVPNAGRLGFVSGNVSVEPAGADDWAQAYPNLPLGPGDRIFTDDSGRAEIQLGQTYFRIGPNTDVSIGRNDPQSISIQLAQGSVHVHSFGIWQGQAMQVATPNANITAFAASDLRVETAPDQSNSIFTSFGPETLITNPSGFQEHLENGQSLEIAGTNPIYPQWLAPAPDDLDSWSGERDRQIANAVSLRYVSPYIPGAVELDAAGDWTPSTPYGPAWFPRNVPADWAPYHYGHWVHRAPWGWTWVEDEQWGYAPFHYGRWVTIGGRWGWIPGPPAARPIYAPALVVFAGGIQVGGVGVSAWFPLGPGEPYRPWYPCPPHYVDDVNISNIRETNIVHVQKTYVNIVNVTNVTNVTYVNRTVGVTAMNQNDFASGRAASKVAVKVAPQQMEHVNMLPNVSSVIKPTREASVGRAPMHPVAAPTARPSIAALQKKPTVAPPPRPPAGRTPVAAPSGAKTQNAVVKSPAELGKPVPAGPGGKGAPPAAGKPAPPPPAKAGVPAPAPREEPKPAPPGKSETKPGTPPAKDEAKPGPPAKSETKPGTPPAKAPDNRPESRPTPPAAEKPAPKPAPNPAAKPAPPARDETRPAPPKPDEAKPGTPAKPGEPKPGEKKPAPKPDDKNKKPEDKDKKPE